MAHSTKRLPDSQKLAQWLYLWEVKIALHGVSTFYIADVIAAELDEQDVLYVGAHTRGPDFADAMAVHWATVWILCFSIPHQSACIHWSQTLVEQSNVLTDFPTQTAISSSVHYRNIKLCHN